MSLATIVGRTLMHRGADRKGERARWSLWPLLELVAARPDRFVFGTFAAFAAERYRTPVAA